MKNVTRDIVASIPTGASVESVTQPVNNFDSMVEAFKEALYSVKIEMDDEEMGHFIDKTVTRLVYQ